MDILSSNFIEIIAVVIGAVLAYGFGRFQHIHEHKEFLKDKIFDTLLSIDLPYAYTDFMQNPLSDTKYNVFSEKMKELANKYSILQISNQKKYKEIKKLIIDIDELAAFNEDTLMDGMIIPKQITDIKTINKRKKEIHKLVIRLYRTIGVESYSNVLYAGPFKLLFRKIYDLIFNSEMPDF